MTDTTARSHSGATIPAVPLSKGKTILGILVLAGVIMLTAGMEWVSAIGQGILAQPVELSISGLQASPLITAAVLVIASAALAAAISSPLARRVALAIAALGGIAAALTPLMVAGQAEQIARSAAMDETSVNDLLTAPELSGLRFIVTALGMVVTVLAICAMRWSSQWGHSASRYERSRVNIAADEESADHAANSAIVDKASDEPEDLIDLWDNQTEQTRRQAPADPGTLDENERNTT